MKEIDWTFYTEENEPDVKEVIKGITWVGSLSSGDDVIIDVSPNNFVPIHGKVLNIRHESHDIFADISTENGMISLKGFDVFNGTYKLLKISYDDDLFDDL